MGRKEIVGRGLHAVVMLLTAAALAISLLCVVATLGLYGTISEMTLAIAFSGVLLFALLGSALAIWKQLPYRVALPLLAVSATYLSYLAWDVAPPAPPTVLPAEVPADSKSYATFRWMLRDGPGNRLDELKKSATELPYFPPKREEWAAFLEKNRAAFTTVWEQSTLAREWIERMAANRPEGIFPNHGVADPPPNFQTIRRTSWLYWARAQLQLIDGRPDDAVRTLLPLLRAAYHLELGGCTLVTQMIATVVLKGTHERLELIAASGKLSPEAKAELAALLRSAPPVRDNLRLAFLGEEIYVRTSIETSSAKDVDAIRAVVTVDNAPFIARPVFVPFLYNPHRTTPEYMAFLREVSRLAQARQLISGNPVYDRFAAQINAMHFKNPVGRSFASAALPAFPKVAGEFWKADDQRLALIKRLAE